MRTSVCFYILASMLIGCHATPAVRVERDELRTGEDVVVNVEGQLDGRAFDRYWVTFQLASAPDSEVGGRIVLEHDEHRVRFHTATPGNYEVRLHDRYPKVENHLVARVPVHVDGYPVDTGKQVESAGR